MCKNIRRTLRASKAVSRSLPWRFLAIWQSRIRPLSTLYRHEKIPAVRAYLRSDREYLKLNREIGNHRTARGYDFGGIRLPYCVVTPDHFLNVFKPHLAELPYTKAAIDAFYEEQQRRYPTLMYCKDICVHGEPKYVGAHVVSHGFTYFRDEVTAGEGAVVFDLGAAPGDFSALCAYRGASKIYAFEPEESAKSDLEGLSALHDGVIEVVRAYAGMNTDAASNTVSLDDFAREHRLARVDFIKADIEGHEAAMLRGATDVLRTYKPKLAICSYHRENDEQELRDIILAANTEYTIYREHGVIHAF